MANFVAGLVGQLLADGANSGSTGRLGQRLAGGLRRNLNVAESRAFQRGRPRVSGRRCRTGAGNLRQDPLTQGERPLTRDLGGPTFGRNQLSSRDDMARNFHTAACFRVHGTRDTQFQHDVMIGGGTRAEKRVPSKPMCRQVLTARTCRALLSCLTDSGPHCNSLAQLLRFRSCVLSAHNGHPPSLA